MELRPGLRRALAFARLSRESVRKRTRLHRVKQVCWLAPEIAHLQGGWVCGPASDEVLVEALETVVSPGTERAALIGLPNASRGFPYIPGYSGIGRVVGLGRRVKGFALGQLVAGRLPHRNLSAIPACYLFPCDASISRDGAAMIELGIIALQGVRKARTVSGEPAVVVGAGIIGQIAIRLLRACGAAPIVAVARTAHRRETALQRGGADLFYLADGDVPSPIKELRSPVVLDATGSPAGLTASLPWVRPGGRVVLLGSTRGLTPPTAVCCMMVEKSITLVGAHISIIPEKESSPGRWSYRDEGRLWLHWLASGKIDLNSLVTDRVTPEDVSDFYYSLIHEDTAPIAPVIQWQ